MILRAGERDPRSRRWVLLVNRAAGIGAGALDAVRARLRAGCVRFRTMYPESAAHNRRIVAELAPHRVVVAVLGGDGTINNAGSVLAGGRAWLAPLPGGTENLLCRHAGLPANPAAAAESLLRGKLLRWDVGALGGHSFLMVAGVGFDGEVVATTDRLLKGVLRQGAFAASVAGLLLRPSPVFGVRWPGGACRRTVQVVFSNGPLYGGGFRVSPAACPFDGRLDMAVFRYRGHFARAFQIAAAMLRGHGKSLFFKRVRVNRAVVLGKHLPAHVDGEPVRVSDVRVSLRPGALWVLGGPHVHGSAVVRGL